MKGKFLRVFLAFVVALPMFTSVLAVSSEDLLARLDTIAEDINEMKKEYNQIITNYPDVIDSLSDSTKEAAKGLADNLMADGMASTVETLKAELTVSTVPDADKVLAAIEDLQADASKLIADNKDVVEEVKDGYSDLTTDEIKQVVEKVTNIVVSLGADTDVSDTYNKMIKILEEAHAIATDINTKLEDVLADNVSTFESVLTKDLLKELLKEVKNKDKEAVIDTLIEAVDNVDGGATLKASLKEVKKDAVALKNKLMELNKLNEQDLLMFTDAQKTAVSNKIKAVEKDYIDFAKVILDNYFEEYMDVVVDLAYNETVDKMIDYANEALDYYAEYKDTVKSLTAGDVIDRLGLPEELIEKAGLMVALGFVDTTDYNKEYVNANFATQIDNLKEYIVEEFVNYLDHIDTTISNDVMYTYLSGKPAAQVQDDLRAITGSRFTTLTNLKTLKGRVDTELLANHEAIQEDVDELADYIYYMYDENILTSITATIMKENDQADKEYEVDGAEGIIITNKFMNTSDFTAELGVPEAHKSIVSYANIKNDKLRTGSTVNVDFNQFCTMLGTFAVLGDVYIDGMIDARDYMAIKNYIMEKETFSTVRNYAADTYRDKEVDARDYMAIKNYIMKGEEISL